MYTISDLSGKTCEERVLYCTISYKNISPSSRNTSLAVAESIYNNRIVTVCDHGRGLLGWTDGRARQAQAASGDLRAGIDGSGGGGAWLTRRAGTRRLGRGRVGRGASRRPKSSQRTVLARVYHNSQV